MLAFFLPYQVNYKRNMPDIDSLMEVWPEEFEALLASSPLPSPDLDLTLAEYAKVLCAVLDIPTYDNPIESLHLMFSLYIDFRNNPHFQVQLLIYSMNISSLPHLLTCMLSLSQARMLSHGAEPKSGAVAAKYDNNYGAADVLELEQQDEYK